MWERGPKTILLVLDEVVGGLLLPGAQLLHPQELGAVRVVEAVGGVARPRDAQRDEDLPAVPRPEPPARRKRSLRHARNPSNASLAGPILEHPRQNHSPRRGQHGGAAGGGACAGWLAGESGSSGDRDWMDQCAWWAVGIKKAWKESPGWGVGDSQEPWYDYECDCGG